MSEPRTSGSEGRSVGGRWGGDRSGIGLLFAPQTGAETRRDVGRYAKKLNCKRLDGVGRSNPV